MTQKRGGVGGGGGALSWQVSWIIGIIFVRFNSFVEKLKCRQQVDCRGGGGRHPVQGIELIIHANDKLPAISATNTDEQVKGEGATI